MPDLTDQIRIYYEATTEPVDIDSIVIEPGTVLVGPFPDAAQRRSAMPTVTTERPPTSRAGKGVSIAASVALIVLIAGAVLMFLGGGTVGGPSQTTTVDDALELVDDYWAAYDAGDFATVTELFTADAVTERFSRSEFFAWLEQYRAWNVAEGTTQVSRDCAGTEGLDGKVNVQCVIVDMPTLHEAVGAPPVRISIDMEVVADGIQEFWFTPTRGYDSISLPFQQWMETNHPEEGLEVSPTPITWSNSVEEAEGIGMLRAQYAEEWAAHLEANGCSYVEFDC